MKTEYVKVKKREKQELVAVLTFFGCHPIVLWSFLYYGEY